MSLLSASGLTCRYGRLTALDDVSLELPAGQRRALIGPNGAGKTTLLGVLAGTIRPTRGRISFAGRDITTLGPARRARVGIARTFQTPALCDSLTVLDNLILGVRGRRGRAPAGGRTERRRGVTLQALRQLDSLGLTRHIHTPAGRLAHGQRRLLEIGVALLARPTLLLLDEPAAGLTQAELPHLLTTLDQLPGSVTVLLVEHHMDVVTAVAEQVTVLHQGKVLTHGTPTQIHTDPMVAQVYLGTRQPAGRPC
jgi:branched-chain amino acid transport system ATP-binding protein